MSITSAFNNASSGLNVSSRRAELISNNIANALTDGFGRRDIHLSSSVLNSQGGGVRVSNIIRSENTSLTSARREAEASVSSIAIQSNYLERLADQLGNPGEFGALGVQFSQFESSLINAANDPGNDGRLAEVVSAAGILSNNLNSLSGFLNDLRKEADAEIAEQVSVVNTSLLQLSELNTEIKERMVSGGSITALQDRQALLLDQLNEIIPIKVVPRDDARIAIFTPSGGTLLDGYPTKFDFYEVPAMAHSMTLSNGALSGLLVNGAIAEISTGNRLYDGGSLEALFNVRDKLIPQQNDQLDALAYDLALRFQDPSIDPTLASGDPGVFTDATSSVVAVNSLGLAGRIQLNTNLDTSLGGGAWKLRAGINSVLPGDIGQNAILRGFQGAMQANISPSVGMGTSIAMSAAGFAEQFVSSVATEDATSKEALTHMQAKSVEFKGAELAATGVDSDVELQNLIEVEAAYAANARVMSILNELLNRLLEL